jgi:hypothetical protein
MFVAEQYRAKAAISAESLKNADVTSEIRELQQSQRSFNLLAQNEDWLANNFDKMVNPRDALSQDLAQDLAQVHSNNHSQDEVVDKTLDRKAVAEIGEHILRCLGAAVIMQWNTIPKKLQRELFDAAGSLGDVLQTAALRGQIARFLHDHKDDESFAGGNADSKTAKG